MPANLPPHYFEAQKRFKLAQTPWEKIQALEEMLAIMPHHKGTDRLRAELTGKIARLSEEAEKRSGAGRKGPDYYVRKEGAGQVALVGLPNVGKSQLITVLTDASSEVADYPFTTKTVIPGMMTFENIQIQLVDMPPLTDRASQQWLSTVLRNADMLLIMVDLNNSPASQLETTMQEMEPLHIGIINWENSRESNIIYIKKSLIVGNKSDLDSSNRGFKELLSRYSSSFPILAISAAHGDGLENLRLAIFQELSIIRIYSKVPNHKVDFGKPFILKSGSTVVDFALMVHKEIQAKLKYAQLWGSGKFDGQRVSRDHVLQDGDIVELHS